MSEIDQGPRRAPARPLEVATSAPWRRQSRWLDGGGLRRTGNGGKRPLRRAFWRRHGANESNCPTMAAAPRADGSACMPAAWQAGGGTGWSSRNGHSGGSAAGAFEVRLGSIIRACGTIGRQCSLVGCRWLGQQEGRV
ncbi:MAG: hypothetical protein KDI53_08845 [Candidatus Accumulibacter sp.]|nr:hypothetical protein [Accumulibacter sp.]